jgi:ribonuclease VapC
LLKLLGCAEVILTTAVAQSALEAAARYGKVAGHPAALNMGDCFSYAMAKANNMPLLYKGDDFAQTDAG